MSPQPDERIRSFREEIARYAVKHSAVGASNDGISFESEIEAERDSLIQILAAQVTDEGSLRILEQIAEVLSVYKVLLRRGLDAEGASDAIVSALSLWVNENASAYAEARLGIRRTAPDAALEDVRRNFKKRGEERFGEHFTYVLEGADNRRAHFAITRCLYNDVLRSLGYPEVIPVFCALDVIWTAEATNAPFPLTFDRPTTLARGDDRCRFYFGKRDQQSQE